MPRTCTICNHASREEIERSLLAGDSYRYIATRFDTSTGALQRHRADHLTPALVTGSQAEAVARADTLLGDVCLAGARSEHLYGKAERILERALEINDLSTALKAIRVLVDVMGEARSYLELRGELTGELANAKVEQGKPAVIVMPAPPEDWDERRQRVAFVGPSRSDGIE